MTPAERRTLMFECYHKGLTPKETAEVCHSTISNVYVFAKNYNIKFAKKEHHKPAEPEFVQFCENHNMKEIIEKYGLKGKGKVYRHNLKFKKIVHEQSEIKQNIIKEIKKGTKQAEIARMFGVSRQYINQIKKECIQK